MAIPRNVKALGIESRLKIIKHVSNTISYLWRRFNIVAFIYLATNNLRYDTLYSYI